MGVYARNLPEQKSRHTVQINIGFVCLAVSAGIAMLAIIPVDYRLTVWLHKWQWPVLSKIMGQSIFEGEMIGGSDFSVIMLILVFACYVYCVFFGDQGLIGRFRHHMGFILIAAFWTCLCNVHGLKWIMGRARPSLVINHEQVFSNWYEWGPHFITHGSYNGSFPSGHTSLAFVFMALAYVLAGDRRHSMNIRLTGFCIGLFAILNALVMSLARTMSLSHWVSDCLASICFSWITIHTLYHLIFRLPQRVYKPEAVTLIPFWEVRLCGYQLLMVFGFVLAMMGIRAVFSLDGVYLAVLIPVGSFLCLYFGRRAMNVWRNPGCLSSEHRVKGKVCL